MSPSAFLRTLTPIGWLALLAALGMAIAIVGHGVGLRWDPFGVAGRRLARAEATAAAARSEAMARSLETGGMADQGRRLEHLHQQTVAVERTTALAAAQARSAHDASTPLDPARADRLVRHDRELCRITPDICAPAAPDAAAGGDPALHP